MSKTPSRMSRFTTTVISCSGCRRHPSGPTRRSFQAAGTGKAEYRITTPSRSQTTARLMPRATWAGGCATGMVATVACGYRVHGTCSSLPQTYSNLTQNRTEANDNYQTEAEDSRSGHSRSRNDRGRRFRCSRPARAGGRLAEQRLPGRPDGNQYVRRIGLGHPDRQGWGGRPSHWRT